MLQSALFPFLTLAIISQALSNPETQKKHETRLPPCRACKVLVDSFKKGMERTEKGKFEGGDTAWEEEKLGSYANSEVRLVEIHEKLCSDVVEGKDQCYTLIESYEEQIEDWWFKKQKEQPDLHKYLCVEISKVCCPENHYGKDCSPCPGFPDNVCNKNGKCRGAGTRKGDGKCSCEFGYEGEFCNSCRGGFYEAYKDDTKMLCSKCHDSCEGNCTLAGPQGCLQCKSGWLQDEKKGCLDINECAVQRGPCSLTQFCVNTEGSFKCINCHKSCAGCTGDGPDMCINCAAGYTMKDNICEDANMEGRKQMVSLTRYLTYLGLCVCTCIILNRNTYLAAIIGVCVAAYITLSEYVVHTTPKNEISDQIAQQIRKAFQ